MHPGALTLPHHPLKGRDVPVGLYERDSFFDLSLWGQVGLTFISTCLAVMMILSARRLLRRHPVPWRIAGALLMFWLFVWLTPQVYYEYYRTIIPDLPLQWVIRSPPSALRVLETLTFRGPQTLAQHGQALLGWILIALQLVDWPVGRTSRADKHDHSSADGS